MLLKQTLLHRCTNLLLNLTPLLGPSSNLAMTKLKPSRASVQKASSKSAAARSVAGPSAAPADDEDRGEGVGDAVSVPAIGIVVVATIGAVRLLHLMRVNIRVAVAVPHHGRTGV